MEFRIIQCRKNTFPDNLLNCWTIELSYQYMGRNTTTLDINEFNKECLFTTKLLSQLKPYNSKTFKASANQTWIYFLNKEDANNAYEYLNSILMLNTLNGIENMEKEYLEEKRNKLIEQKEKTKMRINKEFSNYKNKKAKIVAKFMSETLVFNNTVETIVSDIYIKGNIIYVITETLTLEMPYLSAKIKKNNLSLKQTDNGIDIYFE